MFCSSRYDATPAVAKVETVTTKTHQHACTPQRYEEGRRVCTPGADQRSLQHQDQAARLCVRVR
eukprot:26366-Eustigmatos_ZCMA.PRE.1